MNHRNQKLIAELRKILDTQSDQQVVQPYSSHNTQHRKDQEGSKVVQILPIGRDCLKTSRLKLVPATYTNIAQRNAKNARYFNLPTTPLATVEKNRLSPLFTPFVRPYDKKTSIKNYQSSFSEKVRNEARLAFALCTKKSMLVTISERLRKICDVELSIRQEISEDKRCTSDSTSRAVIDEDRNLDVAGLEEWLDHTLSSFENNSSNYTKACSSTLARIDRWDKYSNVLNFDKKSSFCREIERTGLHLNRVADSKNESFATRQGYLNYKETVSSASANIDRRDLYLNGLNFDEKSSFCSEIERAGLRLDSKDESFAISQGHSTSWKLFQEDIRIDDRINVENWFQYDVITPSSKQINSLNNYAFSTNHPTDEPKETEWLFQTPPRNFNQFQNDGAEMHIPVDCETLSRPDFNNPNPMNWTSYVNSKSLLEEIFPEFESPPSFRATNLAFFHRAKRIRSQTLTKNETALSLKNFQTNEVSWTIPTMETYSSVSISNSDNQGVGIFSQLESISNSQRGVSCRNRKLIARTRDDDGIFSVFSGATPSERNGNYNNNINARLSVHSDIGNSFENMEYEWNFPGGWD